MKSGGLCGADKELEGFYKSENVKGVPFVLGCAEKDAHVPAARVSEGRELSIYGSLIGYDSVCGISDWL